MSTRDTGHSAVRPRTAVLTRGFDPSLSFGSARPAVFRSSTYVFATPEAAEHAFAIANGKVQPAEGERADLIYSRFSHPNAEIFEDQIVPLEPGAADAAVFNSGMAAIMTAFFAFGRPGSSIVYTTPLYGGTTGLIHNFLEPFGMHGIPVASGKADAIDEAIRTARDCAIVYMETPANPTLIMTDIERAAEAVQRHPDHPMLMVDNTFLGPTFQHPLLLGADMTLYSATKYLSGFSDMVAGVALAKDPAVIQKLRSRRGMFGNILQPDECWLLDGRLPTVALRMNRQSKNAQRIAEALHGHKLLQPRHLPDPLHRPRAEAHLREAVRLPRRPLLHRFQGRQGRRVRVPAPRPPRQERRLPGRRRDAHLPSQIHHAFRHERRRAVRIRRHRRPGPHLRRHRRLARPPRRFRTSPGRHRIVLAHEPRPSRAAGARFRYNCI